MSHWATSLHWSRFTLALWPYGLCYVVRLASFGRFLGGWKGQQFELKMKKRSSSSFTLFFSIFLWLFCLLTKLNPFQKKEKVDRYFFSLLVFCNISWYVYFLSFKGHTINGYSDVDFFPHCMYSFGKIGGLWLGSSSTFKAQDRPRIDILGLDPSTIDKKIIFCYFLPNT